MVGKLRNMMRVRAYAILRAATIVAAAYSCSAAAEVPIKIANSGHATVPVEGSFGRQQFVLDTGAEGSAAYPDFAETAHLMEKGVESLQGQTGASDVPVVRIDHLVLDGVSRGPIDVVKLARRADGAVLAGIVGLDVFGDRTLDFDLPRMRASLLAAGVVPAGLRAEPVTATPISGGLLSVPVTIGTVPAIAIIDTGARKTRIKWALARLLGLEPAMLAKGDTIMGATNLAIETASTNVNDVQLGSRHLAKAPVLVADVPVFEAFGVADRPALILGLDWLESTRLVIDFPASTVWFEPAR